MKTILGCIATKAVEDSEPRTRYLRVTTIPLGDAPDWIREKWVGLVLPLSEDQSTAILIDPKTKENVEGFSVDGPEAFKALCNEHPDASLWWVKNCGKIRREGVRITFNKSACELIF